LNPLPRYFVEQVAIIHMLLALDWSHFSVNRLRTPIIDIILGFMAEPHPSVTKEIVRLIEGLAQTLPWPGMNWFENASSYFSLLPQVDARFILELLDTGLLPPASFAAAVDSIAKNPITDPDFAAQLFGGAVAVVLAGAAALDLNIDGKSVLSKSASHAWDHFANAVPELLEVVNDYLTATTFGEMMSSSINLIGETLDYVQTQGFAGLLSIALAFGSAFTRPCCKLMMKLRQKPLDSKTAARISKFFDLTFPFDCATEIVSVALCYYEPSDLAQIDAYVQYAAAIDRSILGRIDFRDTEFYNTFLAVREQPSRQLYVHKCILNIPFDQWVITEDDFEFISHLSGIRVQNIELLSKIHLKVLSLFPSAFIVPESEAPAESAGKFQFVLVDAVTLGFEIPEGADGDSISQSTSFKHSEPPVSPYQFREPSHWELLGFLWYSKGRLLDVDSFQSVQKYAQSLRDTKFQSAFLAYALRHGLEIEAESWSARVKIDRNDRDSFLSFSIFCHLIQQNWESLPLWGTSLVNDAMIEMGYHDSEAETIVEAYKREHGLRKMALTSILTIDPDHFAEFLFIEFIVSPRDYFLMHFDSLLQELEETPGLELEGATLFSQFFFPVPAFSPMEQFNIPPFLPAFEKYIPSQIEICEFELIDCDPEITEKIVAFCETSQNVPQFMFDVAFHMQLTSDQYQRLIVPIQALPTSHPLHLHIIAQELANLDQPFTFLQPDLPRQPSFTRQILALFLSPNCPPIERALRSRTLESVDPVFFNLLIKGFESLQPNLVDLRFPIVDESLFAIPLRDPQLFSRAKSVCHLSPSMAAQVLDFLYHTDDLTLCSYFAANSIDAARLDMAELIVNTLQNQQRYLKDTILTINAMLRSAPLVEMFMMFVNADFLNAPEFSNVWLIFKLFAKTVMSSGDESLKKSWTDFQANLEGRVLSPERLAAMQSEENLKVFASLFNLK
jgi:hypothetical protein